LNKLGEILEKLKAYYTGLKPRERAFVLAGAASLILFILILSLAGQTRKSPGSKNKIIQLYERRGQFNETAQQYMIIKVLLDQIDGRLKSRPADFDLYAQVNEVVNMVGVKNFIIKMDPGQSQDNDYLDEDYLDLNLQRVDLISLVRFMDETEKLPGLVRINNLSIKTRFDQSNSLDVVMRISSYKPREAGVEPKEPPRPKPEPVVVPGEAR
jgi:hypothetical protein